MAVFEIDNKIYNVKVKELKQSFEKISTDKSGRLQNGEMFLDLIGTYYHYTIVLSRADYDYESYDELFTDLSAPVTSNKIKFPHNQEYLEFDAYITAGERQLLYQHKGKNLWGEISINFIAKAPQRSAL